MNPGAAPAPAAQAPAPSAAFAVDAPSAIPAAATITRATAALTQSQLQALNSAPAALGLDPTELALVDRIASLIQDFNPLAFTSLIRQLEALARANAAQSAAPLAGTRQTGTTAPTATVGNTLGASSTDGFQIRELVIKFSGVQESLTQPGGAQAGSANFQLSAFNLQVQEVNLALANPAGQSFQITAPQTSEETSQSSAPTSTQARSAAA